MNDTNTLIELILEGKCVLFLGAGASASSTLSSGQKSPLGNKLSELVYKNFYKSENYDGEPLAVISNMVNKAFGNTALHEFLYGYFKNINPSDGLKKISNFKWKNIYTTNIEQALEEGYNANTDRAQNLSVVIGPYDTAANDRKTEVTLYKLHGCVSRKDVPLVFSLEDYARYKDEHLKLFNSLSTDLIESPVIFIGYSLQDSNFQETWNTIKKYCKTSKAPNKYYFVAPNLKESFKAYLVSEGFTVFNEGIDSFVEALIINSKGRRKSLENYYLEHLKPVKFFEKIALTAKAKYSISRNYDFPIIEVAYPHVKSNSFYKGSEPTWAEIKHELDAQRDLISSLTDSLEQWHENPKFDLWLITGRSGDGKSTLLKRFAHEASLKYGEAVLFAKTKADLNPDELIDLYKSLKSPLIVFIDNTTDRIGRVNSLINFIKSNKAKILLVGATRTSDWNFFHKDFYARPSEFKIQTLSDDEIHRVLEKLKQNDALFKLQELPDKERVKVFKDKSDRVLLVAMKEATLNERFDEIIAHEYANIKSEDAKRAYLHICLINQFRYKVPQSLLLRVLNYGITDAYSKIFSFTEDIIFIDDSYDDSDFLLRARHSMIAEMVVNSYFKDDVKKYEFLQELLENHIPSSPLEYSLVKKLYHHTTIKKLFSDLEQGEQCYELLSKELPDNYYILQQKAIFLCDYKKDFIGSKETISKALGISNILVLQNTEGTIYLNESLVEPDYDKSLFLMEKGKTILMASIRKNASFRSNTYNYHSLINHLISWYQKFNRENSKILEEIQEIIDEALNKYPNDNFILTECGKLEEILDKTESAIDYFSKAIHFNPRNFSARYLLARTLFKRDNIPEALDVCEDGLTVTYENVLLNRLFFEIKHKQSTPVEEIKLLYNDFLTNNPYDDYLRLMFAAYLYVRGDDECDKHFLHLRRSNNIPFDQRFNTHNEILKLLNLPTPNEESIVLKIIPNGYYLTTIRFRTNTYCYLQRRKHSDRLFPNNKVRYNYTFSFQGPFAISIIKS